MRSYIADGYGNHRVIVFDAATGAYKRHWGAYGKTPPEEKEVASHEPGGASGYDPKAPPFGMFRNPVHCVKIANDGLVYVCDRVNNRMQVFRKDGTFVREWIFLKETLGSGSVWDMSICGPTASRASSSTSMAPTTSSGSCAAPTARCSPPMDGTAAMAGQFYGVHNVAIDTRGNVFTTEVYEGKRIQKWKVVSGAPQR